MLDEIGAHFLDCATQLVKSVHTFVYILENIDREEKPHDIRQDKQNRSVHALATSIVFIWVPDNRLPDSGPQQSLKDCNVHQLVNINRLDLLEIRTRYRILVAKILFAHFPWCKVPCFGDQLTQV